MKPWSAEEGLPTAANLNLYRRRFSRVAWHSDNVPLFGERGEPKLIVSMSFGALARFHLKGECCPDSEADSCWLDHGDLLVMDGHCQDEFLHCTDPDLEQQRINVTFQWIMQHVASCPFLRTGGGGMLFANVCAWFIRLCYGVGGKRRCLGTLGSPDGSTHLGCVSFPNLPSCTCVGPELRRRAYRWTRSSGGVRRGHCLRGSLGVHKDNWEVCHFSCWHHLQYRVLLEVAVYASLE